MKGNQMEYNPQIAFLRVRVKELAAEARIIRLEEEKARKHFNFQLLNDLHNHRVRNVRMESAAVQLAYNFLRGKPFDKTWGSTMMITEGPHAGISNGTRAYILGRARQTVMQRQGNVEAFNKWLTGEPLAILAE